MDFFSRLIGGSGKQKQQISPQKQTPNQRLERFKRTYNGVLQTCSRPQQLSRPGPPVEQLLVNLRQLSAILREELRSPAPYTCLIYSAESQVYSVVGRAGSVCKDERVISEVVGLFSTLMDSEMEGFVASRTFARAFMRFSMRVLDGGHMYIGPNTEAQMMEALFAVAAKIRLEPEILPVWFSGHVGRDFETASAKEKGNFVGIAQKDDFPLSYMFIDRVHSEGRIGDFARTGLLYVFEAASRSPELEAWVVASDLPTLMASGLGALYSQLSRELSLRQDPHKLPLLLAMSDYTDMQKENEVESVFSDSHSAHMATFLSDLTFWQDIMDHCQSADVRQTLLDHFQILFLQQLLYPSLLQSSDTDGGSSVAVLTYLTNMLQTLRHPDLVRMMLNYLLAIQDKPSSTSRPRSPTVARRQSFLAETTAPASEEDRVEPVLFNLVDLIQTGLSSRNPQTTFAALKLHSALLTHHKSYALGSLVRTRKDRHESETRTVGGLEMEMEILIDLAIAIGGKRNVDDTFAAASHDLRYLLEIQVLREEDGMPMLADMNPDGSTNSSLSTSHLLDDADPCFTAMINLVERFLTNSVDTNLALTEALLSLSIFRDIDLSGWLAIHPGDYSFATDSASTNKHLEALMDEDERASYHALTQSLRHPEFDRNSESTMLAAFRLLETQVDLLGKSYTRFDAMLAKRKSILQGNEATASESGRASKQSPIKPLSSPPSTPRKFSHARQGSLSSSRAGSPSRPIPAARGRQVRPESPTRPSPSSRGSSVASRRPSVMTPARLSANVFRPPPAEAGLDVPGGSPRRNLSIATDPGTPIENEAEMLKLRIRFPLGEMGGLDARANHGGDGDVEEGEDGRGDRTREVTLSHVLTNVVVLQNFIIELVAVMQLRAILFEEVKFGS